MKDDSTVAYAGDGDSETAFNPETRVEVGSRVRFQEGGEWTEGTVISANVQSRSVLGWHEDDEGINSLRTFEVSSDRDQAQMDALYRRLGHSQAISRLELYECCLPSQVAFPELCTSCIESIRLTCCLQSDGLFEKVLYKFSSLRSLELISCPPRMVTECLLGLVEHPTLDRIEICGFDGGFNQLFAALDEFLESRARKAILASLRWGRGSVRPGSEDNAFFDIIRRHDSLKLLDICSASFTPIPTLGGERSFLSLVRSTRNLRTLILPDFRFRRALILELQRNTSVEEIAAYKSQSNLEVEKDEEINVYLNLNRWFNRHKQELLESPESIPPELWPHIMGRVSLNVNAMHSLVRGHPGIVESSDLSRKRSR